MNQIKLLENRYETMRRKYIKYQLKTLSFMDKTYKLLKLLGLSDMDIINYYKVGYKWKSNKTISI